MRKFEEDDIDSEESEDLKEEELIAMNRHLRNRRSTRNTKMTAQMETLYKDALMDTFFGRFQEASKKLKSHIALCPDHSESYHLLGTMYEQLGEYRNAVEYFFMSAYLSSPNFQKWKKVGEMSFSLQMYNQAAYCFGRALKIENYNIELMTRRAQAFEHSHQTKKAISTYKKILSITFSLLLLKQYAKLRFKRGEYKTARGILMEYKQHQKDPHTAYMICETFLKEDKFEELLGYLAGFIENKKSEEEGFTLEGLNLQFTIFLYICLVRLNKDEYEFLSCKTSQINSFLLQSYEQSYAKEYELLIAYTKAISQPILQPLLSFLIKHKPHKTIENFLLYTEFLKKDQRYEEAIQLLKEALEIFRNSVELTSQLNHIKVVSGCWKQTKRGEVFDFKKNSLRNQCENQEDIFYSDDQGQNRNLNNNRHDEDFFFEEEQQEKPSSNNKKKNQSQQRPTKTKQSSKQTQNKTSLQTQDPQIIKRLLVNCNETLESIVNFCSSQTSNISSSFKQVEDCINFILNLTASQKSQQQEQHQGLFNRSYRRRRYFTSKQSNRQNIINANLPTIISILENVIQFMKSILKQQQFYKVKHLAQVLSKAYFFRWQNKSFELKKIKKGLYEIGLLACLSLEKYETAVFFVKHLVHREPDNSFYLLVVNYLIHNSSTKVCMNSLVGKYASRSNLFNTISSHPQSLQSNGNLSSHKQNGNENNFFQQEQDQLADNLSQNLSSNPRKMSNISNLSDILRDNIKLNYLFGIEYMETGCFDLAINSFLKVVDQCEGEIKKTMWLSLSSCFLQMSSSRNCHSKLPHTNCSTYCFWQYLNCAQNQIQKLFNKARFFAQLRINAKAIELFNQILEKDLQTEEEKEIEQKSAHCLMCIYKEIQDWDKVNEIVEKYFGVDEEDEEIDEQKEENVEEKRMRNEKRIQEKDDFLQKSEGILDQLEEDFR